MNVWFWNFRDCDSTARLDGKTAIVTGSNTGIGLETARDFYKRGCRVIMACRSIKKAENGRAQIITEAEGERGLGELLVRHLDLSSLKSVQKFAMTTLEEEKRIDILVNNAGYSGDSHVTDDGFDITMATNYFGPFYLTMLLLPRMIKTGSARIVNVSSILYIIGYLRYDDLAMTKKPYWTHSYYSSSKVALVLFTRELAKRLEGTGVTVYAVHPGTVKTGVVTNLSSPLREILTVLFSPFFTSLHRGAQTQIHCAVDQSAENETGLFYTNCAPTFVMPYATNEQTAKDLWLESWKLVQLSNYDPFTPK